MHSNYVKSGKGMLFILGPRQALSQCFLRLPEHVRVISAEGRGWPQIVTWGSVIRVASVGIDWLTNFCPVLFKGNKEWDPVLELQQRKFLSFPGGHERGLCGGRGEVPEKLLVLKVCVLWSELLGPPPERSYVEILTPDVMALEMMASGRSQGQSPHGGRCLVSVNSATNLFHTRSVLSDISIFLLLAPWESSAHSPE